MIIDEARPHRHQHNILLTRVTYPQIQVLVSSGIFSWSRLAHLIGAEVLRRICENLLDYMA